MSAQDSVAVLRNMLAEARGGELLLGTEEYEALEAAIASLQAQGGAVDADDCAACKELLAEIREAAGVTGGRGSIVAYVQHLREMAELAAPGAAAVVDADYLASIAGEIRQSLGNGATVSTRRRWAIELEQLALAALATPSAISTPSICSENVSKKDEQFDMATPSAPVGVEGWKLVPIEPTDAMWDAWDALPPLTMDDLNAQEAAITGNLAGISSVGDATKVLHRRLLRKRFAAMLAATPAVSVGDAKDGSLPPPKAQRIGSRADEPERWGYVDGWNACLREVAARRNA